MRALWAALAMLSACSTPGGREEVVAWHGDVEPIVHRVCANCHVEGGIAPGDFRTYDGASLWLELIAEALETGQMPPPVSDPECHGYIGDQNLTITPEERERILTWIAQGAVRGDPALSAGDFAPSFQHLDDADLVLQIPEEHTVATDLSGNEYRCFVLDFVPDEPFSITAFDVRIDNASVLHHMFLFRDPNGDAGAGYGVAPGTKSFDCMNPIMEDDWEPLHAWAPGMPPTILPEGTGLKINAGDQLVMQMHYFNSGAQAQKDQSAYALRTTTEPIGEVFMYPGALPNFRIPAGDPEFTYERSFGLTNLPFALDLYGVFPHMHLLGKRYEAHVTRPSGDDQCIVRGEWDFNHQMSYQFTEPVRIQQGDTLFGSCTWDNSADNPNQVFDPPQQITWGEGTDDEMCVFLLYIGMARD